MDALLGIAEKLRWREVPAIAVELAEKSAATTKEVRAAIKDLPTDGFLDLWHNSTIDKLLLNAGDWMKQSDIDEWLGVLQPLAAKVDYDYEIGSPGSGDGIGTWSKIAQRPLAARCFMEKRSVSPTLSALSQITGFKKGIIPGAPNAMIGTLTGGLLGAGLGYGAGWLGEKLMPEKWERGKLRRTLAILGGIGGAAPGLIGMYSNVDAGRPFYQNAPEPPPGQNISGLSPRDRFQKVKGWGGDYPDPDAYKTWDAEHYKQSALTGWKPGDWPAINVPDFARRVWDDPLLRPPEQAAAVGLVSGASALRGGANLISPMDVARMTAGMGTGYLSGALIGKVFGALTGMPGSTQDRLRNAGLWAGLISNIIPIAFGR